MAFLKKANAVVVHPRVSGKTWGGIRKTASSSSSNFTDQAKKILGGELDPSKYLFTHCTIVASVDTEVVPGAKVGSSVKVGSKTINRPYNDYYIKPECSQFVNNNGDSWSRDVLLSSYRTFIGAHNFQEHVQIEEQSKGRIIDAVARDIGDSVYIDILVATDRKHASLVQDIESGKLGTLSMGCTTEFTICSQCGNFAVDETQLCEHIKYSKLNTFLDDSGKKRVVAELCGHKDYSENGGVTFIEASWVAVPAFTGAVMRNILSPDEVSAKQAQISDVLNSAPNEWENVGTLKAAKRVNAFGFDDEEKGEASAESGKPFQDVENALYEKIKQRVQDRIEKDMADEIEQQETIPAVDTPNDSIVKEGTARHARGMYRMAMNTLVNNATDKFSLVRGIAKTNESFGVVVPRRLYATSIRLGGIHRYGSIERFAEAMKIASGRQLSTAEIRMLVRIGTLISHWEKSLNTNNK